jgi:polyphosphate kinase 2 (PPK2 family)
MSAGSSRGGDQPLRKRGSSAPSLRTADLSHTLDHASYKRSLARQQVRLQELALELYRRRRSAVLVFEGWDAAGKGGAIRRLTAKLDPRGYRVLPIAKPAGEDAARHYLWRFWRRLEPPRDKQLLIFDRSWYGRVLVERVEGFAREEEWRRAYGEINHFEEQLTSQGILVRKFWFHIGKDEQLARFEARDHTPHKRWKLTDEDWRNREKWESYEQAVEEMLDRTHHPARRWEVVAANDKPYARVETLRSVVELLEEGLKSSREG